MMCNPPRHYTARLGLAATDVVVASHEGADPTAVLSLAASHGIDQDDLVLELAHRLAAACEVLARQTSTDWPGLALEVAQDRLTAAQGVRS